MNPGFGCRDLGNILAQTEIGPSLFDRIAVPLDVLTAGRSLGRWDKSTQEWAMTTPFMFATGIENSIPTIKAGKVRVDEMEKCGHYDHWKLDFDLLQELGLQFLRYGPPLYRTYLAP